MVVLLHGRIPRIRFSSIVVTSVKRAKGKKNRKIVMNSETSPLVLGSLEELSKARRSVLDPPWEFLQKFQLKGTKERYRNKGAYIVLEPPNFDHPVFHSFEAITPRPQVKAYYDYQEAIDSDEELDMASMETSP